MKKIVYYSPTLSNEQIIEKMKKVLPFRFKPLSTEIIKRTRELENIDGRVAYIWGDGRYHHESYFFTKNKVKIKINYDYHCDFDGSATYVDYFNHMYYTQKDSTKIILPRGIELLKDKNEISKKFEEYINEIKIETKQFGKNSIALTIDCDAFRNFPAVPYWVYENASEPALLINLIKTIREKIALLDIGGLAPKIKDFKFMKDFSLDEIPQKNDTKIFLGEYDYLNKKFDKKIINRVGNYAIKIYIEVLSAFFFD
ncbi:MAG: hypothetical protein QXF70_02120 [Candidatus Bilamarchaeaceae archaeon]